MLFFVGIIQLRGIKRYLLCQYVKSEGKKCCKTMVSLQKCVIPSCRNLIGYSNSSTFFAVPPAGHKSINKWKQFMSLSGTRKEKICEEHFVPSDFIKHERLQLQVNAIPSQKLPLEGAKYRTSGLCCIRRCCTKTRKILEHFPRKKMMLRKWQQALDLDPHIDTTSSMICRRHFKTENFRKVTSKYLKTSAIPSKKVTRLIRLPKRFSMKQVLPFYLHDHSYSKFKPLSKHVRKCYVNGCRSEAKDGIMLHSFPKKKDYRYKQWVHILKCRIKPTINSKVCSLHFTSEDYMPGAKRLNATALPSVKLPTEIAERSAWDIVCGGDLSTSSTTVSDSTVETETSEKNSYDSLPSNETTINCTGTLEEYVKEKTNATTVNQSILINSTMVTDVATDNDRSIFEQGEHSHADETIVSDHTIPVNAVEDKGHTQTHLQPLVKEAMNCIKQSNAATLSDLLISDKDVRIWTGLQTLALLQEICLAVRKLEDIVPSRKFKFHSSDRVILCFAKLRQNISFEALGTLYRTSSASVSTYFSHTIQIIALILKQFIYRPSKEEIKENIPLSFRQHFGNVTMILDCTEISVASLKCLNCRIACYSNYKSRRTIKFLVGVTPAGLISFVSAAFTGKASDKFIFNEEKLIDSLEPYVDELMVDKGVSIENECTSKCIKLHMPPFLRAERLTPVEAIRNEAIARARIHVERAIQRIKIFKILSDNLNASTLSLIDDIIVTVCGVVNLSTPILKDDKF